MNKPTAKGIVSIKNGMLFTTLVSLGFLTDVSGCGTVAGAAGSALAG